MSKNLLQLNQTKIPKLRFPGFEGVWNEKKLGFLTKIYDGTHQTPTYVKQGIPFYSVEHLTANNFQNTKFISNEVFEKENSRVRIEKNDILMTRIGDIGTARLIDWDVNASFYVSLALVKQSEKLNSKYLSLYINSVNFQKELWKRTIHVAFPKKINLGEIGESYLKFPQLPEQQKIASFLGSADAWIENLREQKKFLESYKKSLMQKIFSQQIRFKDEKGNNFPEWEEKRLWEVCQKKSSAVSANSLEENMGEYNIYGATGFLKKVDFYQEEEPFISIVKDGAGVGRILLCEAKSSVLGTLDIIKSKNKTNLYFLYLIHYKM